MRFSLAFVCVYFAAALVSASPLKTLSEIKSEAKRAKREVKREIKAVVRQNILGARTGYPRLRGNSLEAAGLAAGGYLAFAGASIPEPALLAQSSLLLDRALDQAGALHGYKRAAVAMAGGSALLLLPTVS